MISASAHKPVLDFAFQRTLEGVDPEESVVLAIKSELQKRDSVWRGLLEPVVGARSSDEYIAQVDCTLRARRDARDWRKKAKYWKGNAKQDARHADTVTPSVSQLSDVLEELPAERKRAVEDL
ncbi:hypothetical protein K474DRAFT_1589783, partial [Panus rudis PR-1116 ss-1]